MGRFSLIRWIVYALLPLLILVIAATTASMLGYGLLWLAGDILPLAKVISKITLVLLLLSIFPLKNYLQFSWADLGFAPKAIFFKQMGQGLALGLLTLLPVLLTLYWLDVHIWDDTRHWTVGKIAEKIGLGLFFAMLIAVGEEMLFRGLLLGALGRKMSMMAAVTISSIYYAALHFLKSKSQLVYADLTPGSGLKLIAEAFANWLNPQIISALLALFVVGVFLAILRSRVPQSLGLCIGCHAAWVWQIKVSRDLFNVNLQADSLFLVNTYYDGVVGPLVSSWLVFALIVYGVWTQWPAKAARGN
ncbi:CPBP family intramembrane glutamic endopeptidase [Methylomonas sp. OY6]|uniref:CPBP family intramembrane glutamic endopeptidase n=1 Tax=Methylomonas defluvii TaxID=3045149 RepID=A0ABU4UJT7_9GAMM|nr:CPBP family intramembrane glutamic endopeptidase [Methylomonas sp. OY6]MDX8128969.1 CPBP family intramembrane glutamic endopeptidase [Methylomonas sp. OY6]